MAGVPIIPRVKLCDSSFWDDYFELAKNCNTNLATYYPDQLPSKFILDALKSVVDSPDTSLHQYTKSTGHPRLANILAKIYSNVVKRNVDPNKEILTTLGASEGLSCAILSLIDNGDEVILFEPYYEPYVTLIEMAGGKPKLITLREVENKWIFDKAELRSLFSDKTKAVLLNTPNNPTGKVFNLAELTFIAQLCNERNVICISDEVYEWMVYEPNEHIRIAALPGMWDRTVTIGSAGKTFSITGWKVGWVYGSAHLIKSLHMLHSVTVFTGSTPLQEAIACVLEQEYDSLKNKSESYFRKLSNDLKVKRNLIVDVLKKANFRPILPEAGAFLLVDWSNLEPQIDLTSETDEYKDFRFTKWMAKHLGILTIPATPFFSTPNKRTMEKYLRICFIGDENQFKAAEELLQNLQKYK